ncbi:MAG: 50S ribosomal protein L10 [Planctomycetes bacterium]|nr:50S ribosomal protein L10 [Planctomycetota bacterium]
MPNMLNELLVEQYRRDLGELDNLVAIDYSGLNSEKMSEFRTELRKANLTMEVVKNRIAVHALKEGALQPLLESEQSKTVFSGQTAFLFGGEGAIDAAKFATKWLKANDKTIALKGGLMGKDVLDADGVKQISTLPGKKELLSQMGGGFLALPQKLAGTMQAGYAQVLYAFNALAEKLEKQGA